MLLVQHLLHSILDDSTLTKKKKIITFMLMIYAQFQNDI